MNTEDLVWASNHPLRARLDRSLAARLARRLASGVVLDDEVAVDLGRHRVREVWPWLELCVRADVVEGDGLPSRRHLLLSESSPRPPVGVPCPLPAVWGVPTLRVIVDNPVDPTRDGPILTVDRFRGGASAIARLRDAGSHATRAERCYP